MKVQYGTGGTMPPLILSSAFEAPQQGHGLPPAGDHVHLIASPEDKGFIQLMFGRPEEE